MSQNVAGQIAKRIVYRSLDVNGVKSKLMELGLTEGEFVELHKLEIGIILRVLEQLPEMVVAALKNSSRDHFHLLEVQDIIREEVNKALFAK